MLALGGGSLVDYIFMKARDLSMVNAFKIGLLSLDLNHNVQYRLIMDVVENQAQHSTTCEHTF